MKFCIGVLWPPSFITLMVFLKTLNIFWRLEMPNTICNLPEQAVLVCIGNPHSSRFREICTQSEVIEARDVWPLSPHHGCITDIMTPSSRPHKKRRGNWGITNVQIERLYQRHTLAVHRTRCSWNYFKSLDETLVNIHVLRFLISTWVITLEFLLHLLENVNQMRKLYNNLLFLQLFQLEFKDLSSQLNELLSTLLSNLWFRLKRRMVLLKSCIAANSLLNFDNFMSIAKCL